MEHILAYNVRTRFLPDMQFSQNHTANYGASFKAQNLASSHFSKQGKISPRKKLRKSAELILRKMHQTDEQTNRQTNWTGFIGPLPQRWRFHHAFQKFENKISA